MSSINHDFDANDDDDNNDSINNNNNNQLLHSLSSTVCLFPFIFSCIRQWLFKQAHITQ